MAIDRHAPIDFFEKIQGDLLCILCSGVSLKFTRLFESDVIDTSPDPSFHDAEEDLYLDPDNSPFEDEEVAPETDPSISATSTDLYTPMISSIHNPSPSKPFSNLSFDDFPYLNCESELLEFSS